MYGSSRIGNIRSRIILQKLVTRLNCKLHFCALLLPFLLHRYLFDYRWTYEVCDNQHPFDNMKLIYKGDARSTSKILNIGRVRVGIICILIDAFRIWQN